MANITRKPNGTFLIRVSNGMKNGRQDLVSTIYKPPVGSTSAMARKAAEKYAVLFEELVHSGGYEKKQAVSREIRAYFSAIRARLLLSFHSKASLSHDL